MQQDWRRWALIAGIAALILIALIPGAFLLFGGDDDLAGGGTVAQPPPPPAATTAPPPTSLKEVLMPTQIANGCTKSPPQRRRGRGRRLHAAEGVDVAPERVPVLVLPRPADAGRGLTKVKAGVSQAACGGTVGERVWIHLATGKRGGRRFCATDDSGNFLVVWTHEKIGAPDHVDMLGVAKEPGRSPTIFSSWWAAINDNVGKCRPLVSEETCSATRSATSRSRKPGIDSAEGASSRRHRRTLAGRRFEVDTRLLVGRVDADLTIEDELVSRRHAEIRAVAGALEIEDRGSLNGTWVNGERSSGRACLLATSSSSAEPRSRSSGSRFRPHGARVGRPHDQGGA